MIALRVVVIIAGIAGIFFTLASALRVVILPRGIPSKLARRVFLTVRFFFELRLGRDASYERRDAVMAIYGPFALLMLLVTWLSLVFLSYAGIFWGYSRISARAAFIDSGSSLFTLGFAVPRDVASLLLVFSEAAVGLFLLALLITYLPSLYAAFSRREVMVAMLAVRAGTPPSGVELLWRSTVIQALDLKAYWAEWERWFVELEESHTSFGTLVFFRSPQPDRSWITAAGAILDAASIFASTFDMPREPQAELCIRSGYLALRTIAQFFRIPFDAHPNPADPISVTKEEFFEAYERLAGSGAPVRRDREQCWRDFAGWRVNYDTVLLALSKLASAPPAIWSSDRVEQIHLRGIRR
jgi:hypothetical protein